MAKRLANRVLLLGWDAADWQVIQPLMEAGEMPHLQRLIEEGVSGNLRTLKPILSPMLWTSIATSKYADQHGIYGFTEPQPDASGVRPVTSISMTAQPLWNILEANQLKSAVVGWFATHPANAVAGTVISNQFAQASGESFEKWPLAPNSVSPVSLEKDMQDIRVHPADITAEQILPFIPKAAEIDQQEDKRFVSLVKLLAKCATVHAAGTHLAEHGDWDVLAVYYDAIDLCCHDFMECRAPRQKHISEQDFDHYKDVVDSMYRFHDLMLGRYMRLVGPETTIMIISDHGFFSDQRRPSFSAHTQKGQPVKWHREQGIFAMRGPGVKQDQLIFGASQLDVVPNILAMFGLPVGKDMKGRVLEQCFQPPIKFDWIDSHEASAALAAPQIDSTKKEDPWLAQQALKQLVDLGYIDEPPEDAAKAIENCTLIKHLNLSEVFLSTSRYKKAAEQLRLALQIQPDNQRSKIRLAICLLHQGDYIDSQTIIDEVLAKNPDSPRAHLIYGQIHFQKGDDEQALRHYEIAQQAGLDRPNLHYRIALTHLRQQRYEPAEASFRLVLSVDPDSAESYQGLGVALHGQKRYAEAIEALLRSIALNFDDANSHYYLALSLSAEGKIEGAIASLHNTLKVHPHWPAAHKFLAHLYEAQGNAGQATFHRSKAAVRQAEKSRQKTSV